MRALMVGAALIGDVAAQTPPPPTPAPAAPRGLQCAGAGTTLALRWASDSSVDVYELEAGLGKQATVDTPVYSVTSANASASIPLGADAAKLWFKVRGHAAAGGGIETDVEWSEFSAPVPCVAAPHAAAAAAQPSAPSARAHAGGSRYTMMYRVSELWGKQVWGRVYAPPDFLSSHNSASGVGQASFLTFAELSLMTASGSINTSTITEYCVESAGAAEVGKYLSRPAGGNMSQWGPQSKLCYCAHEIDRYIQHRDFCGGDAWRGHATTCGGTCQEMWGGAIAFTQHSGKQCEGCGGESCADLSAAGKPLCAGCTAQQCDALWSYVWATKPAGGHPQASEARRPALGDCTCAPDEVAYSLTNVGAANISWPPGLGAWYSTPKAGECAEGAPLGRGGCAWRRHPAARLVYGFELAEAGSRLGLTLNQTTKNHQRSLGRRPPLVYW